MAVVTGVANFGRARFFRQGTIRTTLTPSSSISYTMATSSAARRTQPMDISLPMDSGCTVPWMP